MSASRLLTRRVSAAGVHALHDEYPGTIEPARAVAAETLKLERTLVNTAYGLTPADIDLMWNLPRPACPLRR